VLYEELAAVDMHAASISPQRPPENHPYIESLCGCVSLAALRLPLA